MLKRLFSRRPASGRTAAEPAATEPAPTPMSDDPNVPCEPGPRDSFGTFWRSHDGGLDWYAWMYNSRLEQHRAFELWFSALSARESITSVVDFGCGRAVGYAEFLADRRYVGIDLSEKEIAWCRVHRANPLHDYVAADFISDDLGERFDVVLSQGTVDNVYDMDAFLHAAVRASRRWIYMTAYRGYFAGQPEHVYRYNEAQGCFYNDISPARARTVLLEAGCIEAAVVPSFTGRAEIPYETLIVARVGM